MSVRTTSISFAPSPSNSSSNFASLRTSLKIRPSWKDPHLPIDISNLPPLPKIQDSELARQALTLPNYFHQGPGARPDLTSGEIMMRSYEPLELIGDKQLGVSVSLALRRQFPSLPPFPTSGMISRLNSNQTLSFLSIAYGFDKRMHTSSTTDAAIGSSQKTAADLFEAHVGALAIAGQTVELAEWIDQVFTSRVFPSIADLARFLLGETHQKRIVTNNLKRKASDDGKRGVDCQECDFEARPDLITYDCRQESARRDWHVLLLVDGEREGCGRGRTKGIATDAAIANTLLRHTGRL